MRNEPTPSIGTLTAFTPLQLAVDHALAVITAERSSYKQHEISNAANIYNDFIGLYFTYF